MNAYVEVLRGKTIFFFAREHYFELLQRESDRLLSENSQPLPDINWLLMAHISFSTETGECLKNRMKKSMGVSIEETREHLGNPPKFTKRIPKVLSSSNIFIK